MKKVLKAISITFGFFGLATLFIFFAETTTNFNFSLPGASAGNLTADISANNPQLADVSAVADPTAAPAPDAAAPDASPAPSVETPDDLASAPVPAATPAAQPSLPPLATLAPAEPGPAVATAIPTEPDSNETVATATITVTPTAATPPPLPPTAPSANSSPAQIAPTAGSLALPYNELNFAGDTNWQTTWGIANATFAGYLDFSAGPASTGGAVYLKNSTSWANYTMNATVNWIAGKSIGLVANYNNASNYVLCRYTKTGTGASAGISIQLLQYVNGGEVPLSSAQSVSWNGDGTNLNLSVKVSGVYGACSLNGQTISNEGIGAGRAAMNSAGAGGIGFAISDPTPNTSEVVIKNVSVTKN